ncbi:23S rRNA pseudouridine(2604) synthase RluF [Aquimarina addita]|uniref:Pseudouridine synthase n=1 Tax=Aquimarina addita TaxID=870485 RepID=A0ABP7X9E7_9FLAO
MHVENSKLTRLNKYLSEVGYCSRRAADKLIDQGRVTINNRVPEMGTKVGVNDIVRVDGEFIIEPKEEHVYIAFNKPVGIVCTTAQNEKDNIIDYINYPKRIFPIGRLDKPSEGLIFLTSDGDIVNKILRARNNHEKEYVVTVDRLISDQFIKRMSTGIPILDTITRNCEVEQISKFSFKIILTQGLNRQIRRMCEHLGYEVVRLKRVRIMNIKLDVPVGQWRYFTEEELQIIQTDVEDSGKTKEFSIETEAKTKPKRQRNTPKEETAPHQRKKLSNRKSLRPENRRRKDRRN